MTIEKILLVLFFPWIDACVKAAYNEYMLTDEYDFWTNQGGNKATNKFFTQYSSRFMKTAFKKHWTKILFMPWAFETSPEIYEGKM